MSGFQCMNKPFPEKVCEKRKKSILLNNQKAFVFTLEMLFAIMLAVSFLAIMNVTTTNETSGFSIIELKKAINSTLSTLDENGYFLEVLDNNATSSQTKAELIHNKIAGLLPSNSLNRIDIKQYNLNAAACQQEKNFSNCFTEGISFPATGSVLPEDKENVEEEIFLIKKQPPAQCEISGEKLSLQEKERILEKIFRKEREEINFFEKNWEKTTLLFEEKGKTPSSFEMKGNDLVLLFEEKKPFTLLLQEEEDGNISFGVKTNPSDELECDESIHVDLNVSIKPSGERFPADIMLVMDRSGSMDEFTVNYRYLGSGSFNNGTRTCTQWWLGFCLNWQYNNWVTLGTFDWNYEAFAVKMKYSGYVGQSKPRLRLYSPKGVYWPSSTGSSSNSPITITVNKSNLSSLTYPSGGTWTIQGWSDDLINYDLNIYRTKLNAAKTEAKAFIDLAEWEDEDYLGLVSYASTAKKELPLTPNHQAVKNAIDTLQAGGSTATGSGIYTATEELQPQPLGHGREEAVKFQVLLSDGKTNTGPSSATAAQDAKNHGIIIYTIGFGSDADVSELTNIANITGGQFYYASDENTLQAVYEMIAQKIGEEAMGLGASKVYDSNIVMPVPDGMQITDDGTGNVIKQGDQNFLVYATGDFNSSSPWTGYFEANFPCDSSHTCEESSKAFPTNGTVFNYLNDLNEAKQIDWNAFITLPFKYRDLTLDILKAEIFGENQLLLDVRAENIGWLSSDASAIDFYLEDPKTGQFLKQVGVKALCGKLTGCGGYLEMFYNIELNESGYIYAIINRNQAIKECPNNNVVQLYCTLAPKIQYYSVKVWAWTR